MFKCITKNPSKTLIKRIINILITPVMYGHNLYLGISFELCLGCRNSDD